MKRLLAVIISLMLLAGCSANDAWHDDFYTTGTIYSWNGTAFVPLGTGGGGTNDHAALLNLDYASAGHTGFEPAIGYTGNALQYLNGTGAFSIPAGSAGGNVTSSANLTDHTIIRGDGGVLGVQDSGIVIDDTDNIDTNGGNIDTNGGDVYAFDVNAGNDVNVTNDLDVTDNADIHGALTVTENATFTANITAANIFEGANGVLNTGDVDDTPVDGATADPISSNWAYDLIHANATGSTFPTSPWTGMTFLHTPTGRKILYSYDGSNWIPIISEGGMTVYVDNTDGTDNVTQGTGVDAAAFKTIQYAVNMIPGLMGGNVSIYINNETYAETVIVRGKYPTGNYTITFYGTLNAHDNLTATGAGQQGSGATLPSFVDNLPLVDHHYNNQLIKFTSGANNGLYRIIDHNDTTTITMGGEQLTAATALNDTATVYTWGTVITNLQIYVSNFVIYDCSVTGNLFIAASPAYAQVYRCSLPDVNIYGGGYLIAYYCYCTDAGTHVVRCWRQSKVELYGCKVYSGGAWVDCILVQDDSFGVISNGCILDASVKNNNCGVECFTNSAVDMTCSATQIYDIVRNIATGVRSYTGGQVIGTANNQYTNNTANETATAASYGYID